MSNHFDLVLLESYIHHKPINPENDFCAPKKRKGDSWLSTLKNDFWLTDFLSNSRYLTDPTIQKITF